jgi:hypothetical protein
MNTTDTTTSRSHVRGLAASIIADARKARGLHRSADVPAKYRVGREIVGANGIVSGYGVAYPPKFAAAHMPFATTTRQLKRGFVILTDAEAAAIAVAYVAPDGRGQQLADERLARSAESADRYAAQYPDEADHYAIHKVHAQADHAATMVKLEKARTRYGKILAKAQAQAEAQADPSQDTVDAAAVALAADLGGEVSITARQAQGALAAAAAAKVLADRTWRTAIVDASAAGMSHRAIGELAGCTHPTVAKILAEESAR